MEKMTEAIAHYLEDCELGRKLSASSTTARPVFANAS